MAIDTDNQGEQNRMQRRNRGERGVKGGSKHLMMKNFNTNMSAVWGGGREGNH